MSVVALIPKAFWGSEQAETHCLHSSPCTAACAKPLRVPPCGSRGWGGTGGRTEGPRGAGDWPAIEIPGCICPARPAGAAEWGQFHQGPSFVRNFDPLPTFFFLIIFSFSMVFGCVRCFGVFCRVRSWSCGAVWSLRTAFPC